MKKIIWIIVALMVAFGVCAIELPKASEPSEPAQTEDFDYGIVGSTVTFDIFLTYNTEDERADFNMTNSSGAGYCVDPDYWINGSKGCIWTNAWTTLSITVTEENIARLEIWIPVADSADFDLYTIYIDNVVVNVA